MTAARERITGVLRHLSQREEKRRHATAAWARAKHNCLAIARSLLDGTGVVVEEDGPEGVVNLSAQHGAGARFYFEPQQLALVGERHAGPRKEAKWQPFFSLPIEPPARPPSSAPHQWGPSRPDGIGDLSQRIDSQAAFEKAVADWFEWAHMGDGAAP